MADQTVRKASRKKARMRLGLSAPAGAGKTMGALLTAYGLTGDWGKIGLLDTEQGSGELYVGTKVPGTNVVIGEYLYWRVDAPYTITKYLEGMKELEAAGVEVTVLDSISHAWTGAGGLLDKVGQITKRSTSGSSYNAWRDVTPEHNSFVEAMLSSPTHVIATMRSKTEYVLEKDERGKTVPRKVGLAPVQREGMDFEFTLVFEIDQQSHTASASKDRTALFDGEFVKLSPEIGQRLKEWLERGVDAPVAPPAPKWVVVSRDGSAKPFESGEEFEREWRMRIRAVERAQKLDADGKCDTLDAMLSANTAALTALRWAGEPEAADFVATLVHEAKERLLPASVPEAAE